ncbi:MAG: Na/Pi cotransporter family protein, partial [Bacilli bacterium]|nr:Na/Pi cotransporter family protein [Bacilli bacterium]
VGMNFLSSSLQKVAGPGMKKLIGKITKNRFAGVGIGATVTALIQSSAATTVMVIGFVNIGTMTLAQATAVIMGANIGTTVTGLLVSLNSLDIGLYLSVLAFIGIMMQFFSNQKIKNYGGIVCGIGLIFIGLDLMSGAFNNDTVKNMIKELFSNINFPLLLLLLGIVLTAVMQSSSAMTGLIIVMVSSGAMDLGSGLFIILGANIGTCVTALLSTIGTNTNAKRTGLIHLIFNLIGVIIFTVIVWVFQEPIVTLLNNAIPNAAYQIAVFHVVFNVSTTLLLLPFINLLVKLACLIIKDKPDKRAKAIKYIDPLLLRTPSIAFAQVHKEIENMAMISKWNLDHSVQELMNQSGEFEKKINEQEEELDYMNNVITKFLIDLSPLVDPSTEKHIGSYFHVVNDIERIGDYAKNFLDASVEMKNKEMSFSDEAKKELDLMYKTLLRMYELALRRFEDERNVESDLKELSELEELTDEYKEKFSINHFERLAQANCTMELGAYYTAIISSMERIGDHIVNIGFSVKNPTGDEEFHY